MTALALSVCRMAAAQLTDEGVAYRKEVVEDAGVELPVVVDWVRLPAGEHSGVEAQFISVSDRAEMSVFSVPFQATFGPGRAAERAEELRLMLAPTARFEDVKAEPVRIDTHEGMRMTALWRVPDRPADVFAMAVPARGTTVVVFLMMAHEEDDGFASIAEVLVRKTLVLEPPVEVPDEPVGTYDDGRGFSLALPDAWRRILPVEVERAALGAGVDTAHHEPGDVLGFVRPGLLRQSPNVVVSMVGSWMEVSEETLSEFETQYRAIMEAGDDPFVLERTAVVRVAGRDCFEVTGEVEIVGGTLVQTQVFVPVDDHDSLLLTFSVPSVLGEDHPVHGEVERILSSVTVHEPGEGTAPVREPPHEARPSAWRTALLVLALVLAAALLVVLARLRRRRR
jgi:hypothetical protein